MYNKICHFSYFQVYNSAALRTFTMLYHHSPLQNLFAPNRNSVLITQTIIPHFPLFQPLATTVLVSVSMNLPILGTSNKWDHTFWPFVSVYFTQDNIFKVHPCCSMCKNFIPF